MNRNDLQDMIEVLDVGTLIEWAGVERVKAYLKGEVYRKPLSLHDHARAVLKNPDVWDETRTLRKVLAIKTLRDITGAGLKESKDAIEEVEHEFR